MPAPTAFIEGLKSLAQQRGTNVTEVAMLGILAEWPEDAPPDLDDIADIVAAYREFRVENAYMYAEGLLYGAGFGVIARKADIWEATHKMMLNLQDHKAYEHLRPLHDAYLALTGKRFSRTP